MTPPTAGANAPVVMEDVRIIYRNFAGKEGQYNAEGDRNFAVVLDEATATAMSADGWNVKIREPREAEEGEEDIQALAFLPVRVSYKFRPPRVVLITSRGRTNLSEEEIEMLDWADIITCDLIVNPSHWSVGGKAGVKAYLQSMYVTIHEDPLEIKYNKPEQEVQ